MLLAKDGPARPLVHKFVGRQRHNEAISERSRRNEMGEVAVMYNVKTAVREHHLHSISSHETVVVPSLDTAIAAAWFAFLIASS